MVDYPAFANKQDIDSLGSSLICIDDMFSGSFATVDAIPLRWLLPSHWIS